MTKPSPDLRLSPAQRDQLVQHLSTLLSERLTLQQALQTQRDKDAAAQEALLLELLELVDSFDLLLTYLAEHQETVPRAWQRLPKSLRSMQKKLLETLEHRQVKPFEVNPQNPDFNLCRVVDGNQQENATYKVIRQGFYIQDRLLRPAEVILQEPDAPPPTAR
ncbi:nucleotide exchange factor GrpE [Acaryochloris sp. IP29b_bin.137]|uniref:nucleotide exchange factor GrpE n=1 Tax=Acaryochloris sp. IP29b_bin.137 TaxID=2969217 RepID=UPI00262A6880|nr:nucleotide exchange factor GrpE [Acaryochloris sp. IP29b_bin.137]